MLRSFVFEKHNGRRLLPDPRGSAADLLRLVHSSHTERAPSAVTRFAAIVGSETLDTLWTEVRRGADGLRDGLSAALVGGRGSGADRPGPWLRGCRDWLQDVLARLLVETGLPERGTAPRGVVEVNPLVLDTLRPVRARLPVRVRVRLQLGRGALRTVASPALTQALGALFAHVGILLERGHGAGALSVRTSPVAAALCGPAAIRIQVTLTAPGLPAALAHVFDPGQPLSGVRYIVTAHGGAVAVTRGRRAVRIALELPAV
jgi:hypothetical protein